AERPCGHWEALQIEVEAVVAAAPGGFLVMPTLSADGEWIHIRWEDLAGVRHRVTSLWHEDSTRFYLKGSYVDTPLRGLNARRNRGGQRTLAAYARWHAGLALTSAGPGQYTDRRLQWAANRVFARRLH